MQSQLWTPMRVMFEARYGVKIQPSEGICLAAQSDATMETIKAELLKWTEWELAALEVRKSWYRARVR
jgi:chaperone required for assembly of F1-ATPase